MKELLTKHSFLCLVLCLVTNWTYAQVKGTVSSELGEPLPGVSVLIKGTLSGTASDIDGRYSLNASPDDTLIFSFVGYLSQEVITGNKTNIDIQLKPDVHALEELVVIGYGTTKKSDLTGSVASVRQQDVNPGPVLSVSNVLQNTAPGVVMTQTSAQPGGTFKVEVRGRTSILGSNEPLYVIDGMPILNWTISPGSSSNYRSAPDKNPLNGINPEDIVSIEVLKDASAAAIYGARGANGVILITTNQGGGRKQISYNSSVSIQEVSKKWDLLNGEQFAQVTNEWSQFLGNDIVYTGAEITAIGEGTNVIDQVLRRGIINRHQLSFSGGNDKQDYYLSANYFEHKGIVENSDLKRYSARFNLNNQLTDALKIGVNMTMSQTNDSQIHFGQDARGAEFNGVFDGAIRWSPTSPIYNEDGTFAPHPTRPSQEPNPVSILDISDELTSRRVLGTLYGEYQLADGLTARLNLGIDDGVSKRAGYVPLTTLRGSQVNGEGELSQNHLQSVLSEFTVRYTRTIDDKHNLTGLVGYTYQKSNSDGFGTSAMDFASQITNVNDLSSASIFLPSTSFKTSSKLISYIGRVNYSYLDRFLFTSTFRADGSTKFGRNNKWGFFPSAAFAWKIHNESFFQSSFVDQLKFRVSWGQTGNQEIGDKLSQSLYGSTRNFILGLSEELAVGLSPTRPPNDELKWETTTQYNVGFDVALMDARVQASLDLYKKITTDVLLEFTLPSTSGFNSIVTNAGSLQNQGIEFQLSTVNIEDPVKWSSSLNVAYNSNRWRDRAGLPIATFVGENDPVDALYSYVVDGVWQLEDDIASSPQPDAQPGQFKFRDVDGDGEITPDDRVFIGKAQPDLTYGFNNTFTYKKFDLNFFIQGVQGVRKVNWTRAGLNNLSDLLLGRNKSTDVLNRWTPDNPTNNIPSGLGSFVGDDYNNSRYAEDASFVRLRNVTLGYNGKLRKIDFRVYADVQNLLLLTDWTGLDPETSNGGSNEYPNARTYTLGLNLNF